MQEPEKAYTTKEVSDHLGIGTSTLRKWCMALEGNGYRFARTESNKRLFVDRDLMSLKYFRKLVQGENFSLGNASKTVTSRYIGLASETRTSSVLQENNENKRSLERSDELVKQLLDRLDNQEQYIERQEKFNQELLNRLDKQQIYLEERLNKRDNNLMQSLREVQETKQLIVAAREEEEKRSDKGFFARLFGK